MFNKMADYMVTELELNTNRCKETLETLCKEIVNVSNVRHFWAMLCSDRWGQGRFSYPQSNPTAELSVEHKLQAAIVYRTLDLVRELLPLSLEAKPSSEFWGTMVHVGQAQDVPLVNVYHDHIAGLGTKKKMTQINGVLRVADMVWRAIKDQDQDLVVRFMDFYDDNKVKPPLTDYRQWVHMAIWANRPRILSTELISLVLSMCPGNGSQVIDPTFVTACLTEHVEVMEAVPEGMDDLNRPLTEMHFPLAIAIRHTKTNATDIIGTILDAGADIDVSFAADKHSFAPKRITTIEVAIRHKRLNVIKFLILCGATLPSDDR